MEIVVLDKQTDKLIEMEVQPKHTIGSIIETIVDKQKLDKSQRYRLTVGNRSFAKEQYLVKVKDAGINQGDHLFLEAEGAPSVIPKAEPAERKVDAVEVPKPEVERKVEPIQPPKIEEKISEPEKTFHPKFCLQCGKPLRENARFCLECGAPTRK